MKLTKSDILALPHLEAVGFEGRKNFSINGVSIDSRTVKAGELFFALRGDRFDGHNFISKAIDLGAAGILVERRWVEANPTMMISIHIPRLIVENTVHALGYLAALYRRKFTLPVLAVGGSNGKTTTKEMLKSILSQKYRVLSTEGNYNNHIGVPQTLFRLEKKHQIAVVEIGTNHPGEIEYLCTILQPTHGIITNIGREHLEYFDSLEGVAKSEGELFTWLADHRGTSFVNADDKHCVRLSKNLKKTVSFGFSSHSALIKGSIKSYTTDAQPLLQVKPGARKKFEFTVGIPGEQNAHNALAATAIGLTFKVPTVKIQKTLATFQPASKRMQIQRIAGFTVLNDSYNANPDSTLAAITTVDMMTAAGKKIAVLSDMLELGLQAVEFHQQIGIAVSRSSIDTLFTFGVLSKNIHDAASVRTKAHFDNKDALSEYLIRTVAQGDIVLIKGSRSMKMEDLVTALQEHFQQKAGI
jgi:UDP-N-acetylmuramoyl-tripeptide--D-alanyl-D-alanine ligase